MLVVSKHRAIFQQLPANCLKNSRIQRFKRIEAVTHQADSKSNLRPDHRVLSRSCALQGGRSTNYCSMAPSDRLPGPLRLLSHLSQPTCSFVDFHPAGGINSLYRQGSRQTAGTAAHNRNIDLFNRHRSNSELPQRQGPPWQQLQLLQDG